MIHLCASLLSCPSLHSLPVPPSRMARPHTLERLMPCTSILPCHGAIRLEFSLSGSVGPFASLMIALMPRSRMWGGFAARGLLHLLFFLPHPRVPSTIPQKPHVTVRSQSEQG